MLKIKFVSFSMLFIILIVILGCVAQEQIAVAPVPKVSDTIATPANEGVVEVVDPIEPLTTVENETTKAADNTTIVSTERNVTTIATDRHVNCTTKYGLPEVQVLNDTGLIKLLLPDPNVTSRDTQANCLCVLFFAQHCPFSSLAAPHFNALPRAFPDIRMVAINAITYHIFNTQNGIVGVPSVLLLHNGKIIDKFNESDYTLEHFSRFLTKNTGIAAEEKSFVTSADFAGPVASTPNKEADMLLACAWVFIIVCAVYFFMRSKWWRWIVESVKHNWRESEAQAQHEHAD